ncbi:hypothetical protein F4818DRAFT_439557 [Hypoxylon cercidicola]|nr:hypothetical protein F4818DRAFT_439557 [Hypoxylon cercidicola]
MATKHEGIDISAATTTASSSSDGLDDENVPPKEVIEATAADQAASVHPILPSFCYYIGEHNAYDVMGEIRDIEIAVSILLLSLSTSWSSSQSLVEDQKSGQDDEDNHQEPKPGIAPGPGSEHTDGTASEEEPQMPTVVELVQSTKASLKQ